MSRSGSTISMALFSGYDRKEAAQYSFLLSIPAISLSAFTEFLDVIDQFSRFHFLALFVGLITTFFFFTSY